MSKCFNQYHQLRERRLAESTREFLARGKSVARCELCQLADFACLCAWRPSLSSQCEFILLMHRNEVFKPTNTGRLIADLFPEQTHVFCWSRTAPEEKLLTLLQDKNRDFFIVFPLSAAVTGSSPREVVADITGNSRIKTFILLDGTWKQSGRMFHLSRWLENFPCVSLPEKILRGYAVRKSHQEHYLSTTEAAALCLEMVAENKNSEALLDYFQLFNEHYLATRGCYPPVIGDLHGKLLALKSN